MAREFNQIYKGEEGYDEAAFTAEVQVISDTKWYTNDVHFASIEDATNWAMWKHATWTMCKDWRVTNWQTKQVAVTSQAAA
jgi:hypothetical protein